jgi:hypothetical protein
MRSEDNLKYDFNLFSRIGKVQVCDARDDEQNY